MEKTYVNDVSQWGGPTFCWHSGLVFGIWCVIFSKIKPTLKGLDVGCGNGKTGYILINMVGLEKCKKLACIRKSKTWVCMSGW